MPNSLPKKLVNMQALKYYMISTATTQYNTEANVSNPTGIFLGQLPGTVSLQLQHNIALSSNSILKTKDFWLML